MVFEVGLLTTNLTQLYAYYQTLYSTIQNKNHCIISIFKVNMLIDVRYFSPKNIYPISSENFLHDLYLTRPEVYSWPHEKIEKKTLKNPPAQNRQAPLY